MVTQIPTSGTADVVDFSVDDNASRVEWTSRTHLLLTGRFEEIAGYGTVLMMAGDILGTGDLNALINVPRANDRALKEVFADLTSEWKQDTRLQSSIELIAMHQAYQRIIGMGEHAIPLILKDLEQSGGQWYWALRAIAGESPIPPESRGKITEMKEAWLEWGRNNGYMA